MVAAMMARSVRQGACLMVPQRRYGVIRYDGGRQMSAHRASYLVYNGPIPDGLVVRHSCDHIGCIEPAHLLVGTIADNNRDMVERGRQCAGERHPQARTPSDVVAAAVAEYLRGGQSQEAVSAKYGVTQTCLGTWVRAKYRRDGGQQGLVQGKGNRALAKGGYSPCGTRAAYFRHRANGDPRCEECWEANRVYMRAYKDARKADALRLRSAA
jgi:hypothetical protein